MSLRQIAPGARVCIFDRATWESWRPGEILSPGAASLLRSLGCWDAFTARGFEESFGTRAAWGSPEPHENEFLFSLRGNGWRLDRALFDETLRECAASAGVEIRQGALIDSIAANDGWRLQFRGFACEARFVIDASGRTAVFATRQGARRIPDDRLAGAIVQFAAGDCNDTLIEAAEDGWWYSVSLSGGRTVAAFMTDVDLIRQFRLHVAECWTDRLMQTLHTRHRLRGATPQKGPMVFTAHSQKLSCTAGTNWAAAGDAAIAFDPLSSQGILKALRSGKLASFVAADFLLRGQDSHARYEEIAAREYGQYLKTRAEFYAVERRWPENPFWKRRTAASTDIC